MRIVGGSLRGRTLSTPRSQGIRPTTDRTRESLFNILNHGYSEYLDDTRVLDLFAGTGALGIEALSRGCKFALFVDDSVESRGLLRHNLDTLSLQGKTRVFRRDATKLGSIGNVVPFKLVFADPPYGKGLGEMAFKAAANGGWLDKNALLLLEENSGAEPECGPEFELLESREFGETTIRFFRYCGSSHTNSTGY